MCWRFLRACFNTSWRRRNRQHDANAVLRPHGYAPVVTFDSAESTPQLESSCCHSELQPLLQSKTCSVISLSDFLIFAVSDSLPAASLACLRRSCKEMFVRIGDEHHVAFLVNGRKLPSLERLQEEGVCEVKTLLNLHRAETPSLEAVLCIFAFASTEPDYAEATRSTLKKFADLLHEYPRLHVHVEGHGQPGGFPEPLASGLARNGADLVAAEMRKSYGVPSGRIKKSHQSNRCPRFQEADRNRRVELSVFEPKDAIGKTNSSRSFIVA